MHLITKSAEKSVFVFHSRLTTFSLYIKLAQVMFYNGDSSETRTFMIISYTIYTCTYSIVDFSSILTIFFQYQTSTFRIVNTGSLENLIFWPLKIQKQLFFLFFFFKYIYANWKYANFYLMHRNNLYNTQFLCYARLSSPTKWISVFFRRDQFLVVHEIT